MKRNLHISTLLLVILFTQIDSLMAQANEVPAELVAAFKRGSSDAVSAYFNENVDMVVPQAENLYAKNQAKGILADFFRKNQVRDFVVVHRGNKESASFLIGNLITSGGSYRVSIFTRKTGAQLLVYQLRIEKSE